MYRDTYYDYSLYIHMYTLYMCMCVYIHICIHICRPDAPLGDQPQREPRRGLSSMLTSGLVNDVCVYSMKLCYGIEMFV